MCFKLTTILVVPRAEFRTRFFFCFSPSTWLIHYVLEHARSTLGQGFEALFKPLLRSNLLALANPPFIPDLAVRPPFGQYTCGTTMWLMWLIAAFWSVLHCILSTTQISFL
jgi:hypothetical protein